MKICCCWLKDQIGTIKVYAEDGKYLRTNFSSRKDFFDCKVKECPKYKCLTCDQSIFVWSEKEEVFNKK